MELFLTSPWIPAEFVRAYGVEPRGVWSEHTFWDGTRPLAGGVCAFADAAVKFTHAHPNEAVVFASSCDQLRRGFDTCILGASTHSFLFNLPATWQTPVAKQLFRSELERLGYFLEELGGRTPPAGRLQQELRLSAQNRSRLIDAAPRSEARTVAQAIARFHWDGTFSPPTPMCSRDLVPLALVGGPLCERHLQVLDSIQSAGGHVVLNAAEPGERSLCPLNGFNPEDNAPFEALVDGYFEQIVDVFQRPNTRLYSWLGERIKLREVRGIVLWHFTGCDLWRAEAETLRETFELPVLPLEPDEALGISPRGENRIQAFVEALK